MTAPRQGEWLSDPREITRRSFEIIAKEADFSHLSLDVRHVAARIIHACGLPQLAPDIRIAPGLQKVMDTLLEHGGDIFVDTKMVQTGIMRAKLPPNVKVHCLLRAPETQKMASELKTTLTAASVRRWKMQPQGAVCIIGNAPTALFELLRRMEEENLRPLAVLGFPVGFVGAAESKELLNEHLREGLPAATVLGRPGGAGMAAAAFNAMLLHWRHRVTARKNRNTGCNT